jgi:hypothetical protein
MLAPIVVAVRALAGAAGRLMGAYQGGLLTLQRLRSEGTRKVVVQHVTVEGGGQAVVAGFTLESARYLMSYCWQLVPYARRTAIHDINDVEPRLAPRAIA